MNNIKEIPNKTDFPAVKALQINSCGIENHTNIDFHVFRPNGRKDYHFLYIKSGFVIVTLNNKTILAKEGQCIVFFPGVAQDYSFLKENNACTYYLHFTGIAASEAMGCFTDQSTKIYNIINKTSFEEIFHRLIRTHDLQEPLYTLEENCYLLRLITLLARLNNSPQLPKGKNNVIAVTEYIYEHFSEDIDFHQHAENLYLSYSHFVHLFTKYTGFSPHKFLLKVRIDKAKDLLMHTQLNICEIATHIGFSDPLYFSRLFRKYLGLSPSDYRSKFSEMPPLQ